MVTPATCINDGLAKELKAEREHSGARVMLAASFRGARINGIPTMLVYNPTILDDSAFWENDYLAPFDRLGGKEWQQAGNRLGTAPTDNR